MLLEGTSPEEKLSPDQKIELLKMKNYYGNTPLHSAIENNNNTTINLLLKDLSQNERFALLKITTNDGLSPLHSAINKNNNTTINLLLEGTSPEQKLSPDQKIELLKMKNQNGNTPLSWLFRIKTTQP